MAFSMIQKNWDLLPVVAHPGPPRAIIDNEAGRADARPLLFYTASALEQARLAGYKTTTPDFRQALHCRDSVGIRTQDPQLRRLLLYPTELPNRSVFAFGLRGSEVKSGCKDSDYFWICNMADDIF